MGKMVASGIDLGTYNKSQRSVQGLWESIASY